MKFKLQPRIHFVTPRRPQGKTVARRYAVNDSGSVSGYSGRHSSLQLSNRDCFVVTFHKTMKTTAIKRLPSADNPAVKQS